MAEPEEQHEAQPAEWTEASAEVDPATLDQPALLGLLHDARQERDQQRASADQYLGMLQRVQADFVNYKRRVESEQEARAEAVRAETVRPFLTVVDDLDRALAHLPPEAAKQSWAQGFSLIQRNLAAILERLGVQRLGTPGEPFDPNIHEAVAYEEHRSVPDGHVATVHLPGYRLGERVIRAAQVSVARAPAEAASGGPEWPHHEAGRAHGNGGASAADTHRPRPIDRT